LGVEGTTREFLCSPPIVSGSTLLDASPDPSSTAARPATPARPPTRTRHAGATDRRSDAHANAARICSAPVVQMRTIAVIFAAAAFSTCVDAFVFSWFQPVVRIEARIQTGSLEEMSNHDNLIDNGGCFSFDANSDFGSVKATCSSYESISYGLCATSSCGTCDATVSTHTYNVYIPLGPGTSFRLYCTWGPSDFTALGVPP